VSNSEPRRRRTLRATYRLQLTPDYGFAFARGLVPYLTDLGVSHLYLSPSLQARTGSTHGYDVVDPSQLSGDLGGEAEFRALADAAHAAGLGLILDVVPNHMAASNENRYWADPELRERFFDVDAGDPHQPPRWRRFFDIDDLAGIRIEREEVFEATHAKVLSLVSEGVIDGLRVDHPDGLADPEQYLQRLADAGAERVWVEKILGAEERVPDTWPVSGTVGYDFLNDLIGLSINPDAEATFTALWDEISGDDRPFGAWAWDAKREQTQGSFTPEVQRLSRAPGAPGVEAIAEALSSQPLYRSYIPTSAGEYITRFQQTSPAIMAKGVEDTSFYRYNRLLALNEVGGEPGRFTLSVDAFHAHNAERALMYPEALLTTMTHDAKRSADVRARIAALTWVADEWTTLVRKWLTFGDGPASSPKVDPIDRYFILQTLLAFPAAAEERWARLDAYFEKALRESKRNSNWIDPDTDYEDGVKAWARALSDDDAFAAEFAPLVARAEEIGERISLAWVALKILSPGVPDIYQGDELEYSALVDPDNRRPVDWDARRDQLAATSASSPASSPEVKVDPKLKLVVDLLALRARRPEAFGPGSEYRALPAEPGTVAFSRTGGRGDDGGGTVEVRVGIHPSSGTDVEVHER
jgi:(1->4)-alpha-D-glucan 1-alpha-D-glucosylmutase